MKKITFKGSYGIYDIFVNGKQIKYGDMTASVHISKEISEASRDDVTIYIPREEGHYHTATFPNPHDKDIVFSFARKYVRLFI